MASRYTDVETITPAQRLQLQGLLTLGHRHVRMANEVESAMREITGEDEMGHSGDELWSPVGGEPDVDYLLERLGITVEPDAEGGPSDG